MRLGLDFPVLSDVDRSVIRAFGVEDAENEIAWPAIFIVDRAHKITWRWVDDDYRIRITTPEILKQLDSP